MNWFSRGIRNAFRNPTRTVALTLILSLSIGLSLAMLIAHQAVSTKIDNVKSSVDNTITVFPAGIRGFAGGGSPLTETQLNKVSKLSHVSSISETLSDRLDSTETNLVSAVNLGSLGQRFATGFGGEEGGGGQFAAPANFTPPITVNGTNNPTNLSASAATSGGGSFKLQSGSVFAGNSTSYVALVGSTLASKNNLSVGSTFSAYSSTIKVVGIFSSGNSFGDNQVILPLATLQQLAGEPGAVTSATVNVDSLDNVSSVTNAIKNQLGSSADVTSAQQQSDSTVQTLKNIQTISLYSLVGAAVAGAIIILMTMIMIVRERKREIGVVKALGSSNLRIAGQFMAEATTLTLIAAIVGIIIGALAGNPITQMLVNNSSPSTSTSIGGAAGGPVGGFVTRHSGGFLSGVTGFGHGISKIHAAVGFGIILDGLAAAVAISIVGAAVATYFIARIRPSEVMRVE